MSSFGAARRVRGREVFLGRLLAIFFILTPFSTGGEPSTDESYEVVVALDVRDNHEPVSIGQPDQEEPHLRSRVIRVGHRQ
jgi:hypothetical protein